MSRKDFYAQLRRELERLTIELQLLEQYRKRNRPVERIEDCKDHIAEIIGNIFSLLITLESMED